MLPVSGKAIYFRLKETITLFPLTLQNYIFFLSEKGGTASLDVPLPVLVAAAVAVVHPDIPPRLAAVRAVLDIQAAVQPLGNHPRMFRCKPQFRKIFQHKKVYQSCQY